MADETMEQVKRQAMDRGIELGIRDGLARAVSRLCEQRFGEVPEHIRTVLPRASVENLEALLEMIVRPIPPAEPSAEHSAPQ